MQNLALVVFVIGLGCARTEIEHRIGSQSIERGLKGLQGFSPIEQWKKICSKSYSSTCLKFDVVSFVDRLSEQNDIGILPGVSIVKQNSTSAPASLDVVANLARDFPDDVDKRMDVYLAHRIGAYLSSHAITIKLFDPRTFEAARGFNEQAIDQLGLGERSADDNVASARKKDKGGYGHLMAGLMMMKGTLGALGFGTLAMLAGKALMTGLMALMLSAIVGLKSLASGEKKTTYEIVSKPVYTTSHSFSSEEHHGGGAHPTGYARSLDAEAVREAVRAYGNVRDRRAIREA